MWRAVHQHLITSMTVLVVDNLGITFIESERDTPVATDSYRPNPSSVASKVVKEKTRQIHILGAL
jgi:hypothetical protein